MNMRERMLAVVRQEEHDMVPFAQYELASMPSAKEVWELVGRENMGLIRWINVHRCESPHCQWEAEDFQQNGLQGNRLTLHTPEGSLVQESLFEPAMGTGAIRRHSVQEPEDYRVLLSYFRDLVITEDLSQLHCAREDLGENGVPHCAVDRTPYQQLWVQWVSLENLSLHMADCPELVHECILAMERNQRRIFEIVRNAPLPYVVFPDNITAPVIGEKNFRHFCMPYYDELADMLSDRDIPIYVHMDGDLKPLWEAIGESKVRGLDSMSPPPDNDTSVEQAAAMWPDMRLWVNFPSSIHLASPKMICDTASQMLERVGHTGRLQVQISENVPPGLWRKSYPEIIRAIQDFGRP